MAKLRSLTVSSGNGDRSNEKRIKRLAAAQPKLEVKRTRLLGDEEKISILV